MQNQQQEELLSPEELEARKEEMKKFYDESLPYLESQCKHEEFLARIAEARYKRFHYDIQFTMLMQGPDSEKAGDAQPGSSQNKTDKKKLRRE